MVKYISYIHNLPLFLYYHLLHPNEVTRLILQIKKKSVNKVIFKSEMPKDIKQKLLKTATPTPTGPNYNHYGLWG